MNKLALIFLLFILLACTGDENSEDITKIKKGMTISQTKQIMRNKYKIRTSADYDERLFIDKYDAGPGASDDLKIIYRKTDSVVVDIGLGD